LNFRTRRITQFVNPKNSFVSENKGIPKDTFSTAPPNTQYEFPSFLPGSDIGNIAPPIVIEVPEVGLLGKSPHPLTFPITDLESLRIVQGYTVMGLENNPLNRPKGH